MTAAETTEYQTLQRESSNHLLEHDSRLVLGRYEEAARHMLEAGLQRVRMGRIQFEARRFVEAAEDWLSAAECFLRANDATRAGDTIRELAGMRNEGVIPGDRADLIEALRDRERRLQKLIISGDGLSDGKSRAVSSSREPIVLPETAKLT